MEKGRARVLAVDDDQAVLEMVSAVLADEYRVTALREPEQALRHATDGETFDVAVIDLEMPGMHGLALAERLREASPDTQIVILTGYPDVDAAVQALHFGVFDFLRKGQLDVARLEGAVASGVERCRLLRENRELSRRLARSLRLLEALNQVAVERGNAPGLDVLAGRVATTAKALLGADCVRLLLFARGPAPGGVVVERALGEGAEALRGRHARLGEALLTRVADDQQALCLERATDGAGCDPIFDVLPTERAGFLCVPLRHGAVFGALAVAGAERPFGEEELDALRQLAAQAAVGIENADFSDRVTNYFTHTAELLVSVLDRFDTALRGHSRASALLADMLTRRLGLSDAERRAAHYAALLHDLGKLAGAPRASEAAPGEGQAQAAIELLRPIAWWHDALPLIALHRERWDGTGEPGRLAGNDIPLGARVLVLACEFDTLRRAQGREAALRALEADAGTRFDPRLVRLFVSEYRAHADEIEPARNA